PMGDESWCRRAGVTFVTLDELLSQSDFITVHVPLTDQTRGLLNSTTLAKAKKGVRVINCARGGIVDEKALIESIEKGHVKGAALDVFEKEPLDPASPLLKHPEIILTPHLGASTEEAQVKVALELSQAIVDFFQDGFARQAVNLPPLDVAGQNQLLAFVGLAYKQGAFLAQVGEGAPVRLTLRFSGELGRVNPALYTATAAAGYLSGLGVPATAVNALLLAQQRGLQIQEQVQPEAKDYASLLEMEAATATGAHQLAGTVYGRGDTRFVRIDGLAVDVTPHKYLLVMTNEDRPGVVGHTGTVLSAAGINIAGMDIARNRPGGVAVSLWSVDSPVPAEVLAKVKAFAPILSVKMVQL
ncbi:MAG TPA: NAD(P)-dependent oxidoreductase, partial [Elusimicrobiota bacterium]|nr:NAD(P)-dependent oxidoreductase [Elusimicrobiota bacterium]